MSATITNRIKSYFVTPYILMVSAIGIYSTNMLLSKEYNEFWIIAAAMAWAPTIFFAATMIKGLLLSSTAARTKNHIVPMILFTGISSLLVLMGWFTNRVETSAAILSLLVFGGWLLYDFWYSTFGERDNSRLQKGKILPPFVLKDKSGNTVSSTSLLTQKAIFLFFRGNWCPLCMAQIREVAAQYNELEKRGVQIYLVSPQPEKNTEDLSKRFNVSMNFMTDPNLEAAKVLGIFHAGGLPTGMEVLGYQSDTVLPTVIITDTSGKIIYSDLTSNYRIRPEPAEFLAHIDEYETKHGQIL